MKQGPKYLIGLTVGFAVWVTALYAPLPPAVQQVVPLVRALLPHARRRLLFHFCVLCFHLAHILTSCAVRVV